MSDTEIRSPIAHRNVLVLETANAEVAEQLMCEPRLRRHVWRRFDDTRLIVEAEAIDIITEVLRSLKLSSASVARLEGRS